MSPYRMLAINPLPDRRTNDSLINYCKLTGDYIVLRLVDAIVRRFIIVGHPDRLIYTRDNVIELTAIL